MSAAPFSWDGIPEVEIPLGLSPAARDRLIRSLADLPTSGQSIVWFDPAGNPRDGDHPTYGMAAWDPATRSLRALRSADGPRP